MERCLKGQEGNRRLFVTLQRKEMLKDVSEGKIEEFKVK